ncbi:unnamed protein product [Rotaria sordida]|uniref:ATP-dependent DNA helicase n=1 Tax=Rotaria sordida TaxID=392033 RepID=A0A815P6U4_9BILA|nr:unnamed protein product [Rotaria sordida]CAF1444877.1 unnamed protein product [Rotaria sordida]CAF1600076.1 unnamed protein product [Rotaria sordida]CAF3856435.1 unnamed protein product [Rotaria sordida]
MVPPVTQPKGQANVIASVTAIKVASLTTQLAVANEFTLNDRQKLAFMIITGHLDGDSRFRIGISHNFIYAILILLVTDNDDNQLLMCVPGCGGTGKSQLIRAITKYFEVTKRLKMLRKLAPTSIAAAEIDGLTIHSFLGESHKVPKKQRSRTFKPGDMKLETQWRHVKYLIIDEMSMCVLVQSMTHSVHNRVTLTLIYA